MVDWSFVLVFVLRICFTKKILKKSVLVRNSEFWATEFFEILYLVAFKSVIKLLNTLQKESVSNFFFENKLFKELWKDKNGHSKINSTLVTSWQKNCVFEETHMDSLSEYFQNMKHNLDQTFWIFRLSNVRLQIL